MGKKATDLIDKHVGTRVRMRRLMLNVSQERLGNALGVSFQQVQKYEKGTNRISASRLQQVSEILKVAPSFFFEGTRGGSGNDGKGNTLLPDYVNSFLATPDGLALARAFSLIRKPKLRRCIADMIEQLAAHR